MRRVGRHLADWWGVYLTSAMVLFAIVVADVQCTKARRCEDAGGAYVQQRGCSSDVCIMPGATVEVAP